MSGFSTIHSCLYTNHIDGGAWTALIDPVTVLLNLTPLRFWLHSELKNVKNSLQWVRDVYIKLNVMTEVRYDRSGCFININMVDKADDREFHLVKKDGVLKPFKGLRITGKIKECCEITELENEKGKYVLSYNVRGLLETETRAKL